MKPVRKSKIWILLSLSIAVLFLGSSLLLGCNNTEGTVTEENAASGESLTEEEPSEEASLPYDGKELLVSGSTTLLPFVEPAAAAFMEKFGGSITINGGGSGVGVSESINGINDIGDASRQAKEGEIEGATKAGIELVEVTVAYDGISVIVSENINVPELTIRQLSDIFRGEITNWNEVGGDDAEIILASRDSNSGTFEYFLESVVQMGKSEKDNDFSPMILALQSNADIVNTVTTNDNAIGYIGLGYLQEALDKGASAVTIDGVYPSVETVQDGTYPISRGLYNYYRKGDLSEMGEAYLNFLLSDEGQQIALDNGFVSLNK
jgi:phosphate transport system substrate-binding protein